MGTCSSIWGLVCLAYYSITVPSLVYLCTSCVVYSVHSVWSYPRNSISRSDILLAQCIKLYLGFNLWHKQYSLTKTAMVKLHHISSNYVQWICCNCENGIYIKQDLAKWNNSVLGAEKVSFKNPGVKIYHTGCQMHV